VAELEMLTADGATAEWLRRSDRIRVGGLAAFLVVMAIEPTFGAPLWPATYGLMALWLGVAIVFERSLQRVRAREVADRWRTAMLAADIVFITLASYEADATRWFGESAYLLVVVIAAGALSRGATVWITAFASLAYGALLLAERAATPFGARAGTFLGISSDPTSIGAWALGTVLLIVFVVLVRALVALLERSEARHRLMFEASPRPMWVYDAETLQFLAVNNAAIRDYGYSRDEFLAMDLTEIRPPDERDAIRSAVAATSNSYTHSGTWRHRRRDGREMDVEVASHPIRVGGRQARLVVVTDVTERTRLETRLRETQRLEALGRLAGGVAHEFNNLLAAVLGHAELLLTEMPPGSSRRDSAEEIVRAARRGADLTRHMLAFGRRQILRPEVVDVSAVVRDIERLLRPLLTAEVRVSLALPTDPCWARVDRSQLELVIMNLTMNARDAMPGGGALTVQTSVTALGEADRHRHPMAAVVAGKYVRLAVSDSGMGISPDVVERIFEPFFTTKPVGRGTGLGLSTVYGIVKQSDGYVWPYSEVGHGTSMHVYLPCVAAPVAVAPTPRLTPQSALIRPPVEATVASLRPRVSTSSSVSPAPVGGAMADPMRGAPQTNGHRRAITVLVADDEAALRSAAARALRVGGYDVLEAGSGEEALAVAAAHGGRIDVLLTDVVMPGIGGVELAARAGARDPAIRVVYMSGYPQSHLEAVGGLAGGHAFLDKPFGLDTLLAAVQDALAVEAGRH
jgi:two-component system, cell cycle sensor histidine kinase and response regulator CckA